MTCEKKGRVLFCSLQYCDGCLPTPWAWAIYLYAVAKHYGRIIQSISLFQILMSATTRKKILLYTSCVCVPVFLLVAATWQSLAADFSADNWKSLAVRLTLIGAASLLIGRRLGTVLAREQRICLGQPHAHSSVLQPVFFPLAGLTSFVGQSFQVIGRYLERIRTQKGGHLSGYAFGSFPGNV